VIYESIESWNLKLFQWINANASPPLLVKWFAILSAEALIYLLALGMVVAWVRGSARVRVALLYSAMAAFFGLVVNQIIGLFWYHPRPFEMGIGNSLTGHAVETSFPSDHAVVFFCVGLALLWIRDTRRWGTVITILGLLVAWSRVYLGIHFPLDMLGALFVSIVVMGIAHKGLFLIERQLEPSLTRIYERVIDLLHLPTAWFPTMRRGSRK